MSKKSDLVRGMGLATQIVHELVETIQKEGGTEECIHQLATEEGEATLRRMARIAIEAGFPTWIRIRLGGHKRVDALIEECESKGVIISDDARDIASKLTMSSEQEFDLVKVTVRELGFIELTRFGTICDHADKLGLKLVPQDAALYAALQAGESVERGELIIFAMESIIDSGGHPNAFGLVRFPFGELKLDVYPCGHGYVLGSENRLVFSRA